ncbi:MAG: thioredoxin domain-containing protein [Fibrobacterota bacterium]|nr:thioredoxin domain-containing protein [Fibrobacterota bacterium]QQS05778.1 MAG: thioredoxin domain-containing protein [Fibrobacterota bacterium]
MKIQSLLLSVAFLASCAQSKSTPEIAALNKRIDSLTGEMKIIKAVLASKQLDVDHEWARLKRQDSAFNIPVDGTPIYGDPKAPLSVVLFTDLQCPYCAQIIPLLKNLQASHPKSLKISFRHFPLTSIHEKAMFAHQNLWAAGQQGKFWEYYLEMAPNFRGLTDSALVSTAKSLKLDMARFEVDRKSAAATQAVTADMQLGESVGVDGTPAMFFNGKLTRNPNEINEAASKLDAQLAK